MRRGAGAGGERELDNEEGVRVRTINSAAAARRIPDGNLGHGSSRPSRMSLVTSEG
jgi:hypothetical protein